MQWMLEFADAHWALASRPRGVKQFRDDEVCRDEPACFCLRELVAEPNPSGNERK